MENEKINQVIVNFLKEEELSISFYNEYDDVHRLYDKASAHHRAEYFLNKMANEQTLSERTREVLVKREFFVLKFNDASRTGIPDMQISANGKTVWVEDKYLSLQFGIGGSKNPVQLTEVCVSARAFISKDRLVQLVTMCKLQKHAYLAQYWLYIECDGKYYIAALEPRKVFESFRDDTEMKFSVMGVTEWRQNFEIK
jgi:hypothetical protein